MAEEKTPPTDSLSAIIALYKRDVDRTLIRENLRLTVEERLRNLQNLQHFAGELREAGRKLRHARAKKVEVNDQQL